MMLHLALIRGVVDRPLNQRHAERIERLQADWQDEASAASLAGNPRRGLYLEHMAGRLPALVEAALKR